MDLTPEQARRVAYLATDQWVVDTGAPSDEAQSWANFATALNQMSSIELHHFARHFNWDCGVRELDYVVEHPECDAGTALMIYWLGQPATCYRMARKGDTNESLAETIGLLRKIEQKFDTNSFQHSAIACDPGNIMGQRVTMGTDRDREVVPAKMFEKLEGHEIVPPLLGT